MSCISESYFATSSRIALPVDNYEVGSLPSRNSKDLNAGMSCYSVLGRQNIFDI